MLFKLQVLDEDREISDHESDLDQSSCETNRSSWIEERKKKETEAPILGEVSAGRQAMSHLLIPPLELSGRETPVSVDSIPLEWDHTVDVGESTSQKDEEDASLFSALSGDQQILIISFFANLFLSFFPFGSPIHS